jgi:hypothetical protein
MKMKLTYPLGNRYSGPKSKAFWARVKKIPYSGQNTCHGEVYSLGCALQDLEERVLSALQRAEMERKK